MEMLVVLLPGILVMGLGAYMLVSGNPSLLHSYHYATTPSAELPVLAREAGAGTLATGLGCVLLAPTTLPTLPPAALAALVAIGVLLLIGGIAFMLASIVRHNGGLITFGGTPARGANAGTGAGSNPAPRSRMPLVACVIAGVVIAATCIAPGAYMIATGDVTPLHSYHYANVAAEDLPALATGEGLSMIGLGVGIFICLLAGGLMATPGRADTVRRARPARTALMLAGALITAASLAALLLVIIHYNGSLMG